MVQKIWCFMVAAVTAIDIASNAIYLVCSHTLLCEQHSSSVILLGVNNYNPR